MSISPRGVDPGPLSTQGGSAAMGFSDTNFIECLYIGTSGALLVGMPVFAIVTDAAELNTKYSLTAPTPAKPDGCQLVTNGTGTGATNLLCVGVFVSDDQNAAPVSGTVIKVCNQGIAPVYAAAKASGTTVKVGDVLVVDTTPGNAALSNGNTFVTGRTIGVALATLAAVTSGSVIIALPGSGTTAQLINAAIKLT